MTSSLKTYLGRTSPQLRQEHGQLCHSLLLHPPMGTFLPRIRHQLSQNIRLDSRSSALLMQAESGCKGKNGSGGRVGRGAAERDCGICPWRFPPSSTDH